MPNIRLLAAKYSLLIAVPVLLLSACSSSDDANSPAVKNLEAGKIFLAENQKKAGVKILERGLQYEVVREGNGKQPKLADQVNVHYRGMHLDGSVFSESDKKGKPETVSVKNAITGWRIALLNMTEGSKWRIYLPSHLAFSNRGVEGMVEPNETIIYEIELLNIVW